MQLLNKLPLLLLGMVLVPITSFAAEVEIYLLDKLDGNLNHYCIDMQGFQERADITANLQTHTCYSYQGELAVDQTMDTEIIEMGLLKVDAFDVCAILHGTVAGSTLGVAECAGAEGQSFELTDNGEIRPAAAPNMCLTAGPSSWAGGRNNDSPHQIRTLDIQPCSDEAMVYQRWGTRVEMTDQ